MTKHGRKVGRKERRKKRKKKGRKEGRKGCVTVDAGQETLSVRRGRRAGTQLEDMSRSEQPASSEQ